MSTKSDQDKRFGEIHDYLLKFKEFKKVVDFVDIDFIDNAFELINTVYWRYTEEFVRRILDNNNESIIQRYKICSNLELAILLVSPILHEDKYERKALNAELAFFTASSLLIEWVELDKNKCKYIIDNIDREEFREIGEFIDEHQKWLRLLDPKFYYPIFSNSQVWRLYHYVLREITSRIEI